MGKIPLHPRIANRKEDQGLITSRQDYILHQQTQSSIILVMEQVRQPGSGIYNPTAQKKFGPQKH